MSEEIGYCTSCRGEGVIHTGIDEAPVTECSRCDGTGELPAAATLPAAPAPTEQPAHETIVREGNMLTCTACGTSKKMSDPCAAATEQAEELPPLPRYGIPDEMGYTTQQMQDHARAAYVMGRASAVRDYVSLNDAALAARPAPTEAPKEPNAWAVMEGGKIIQLSPTKDICDDWLQYSAARTVAPLFFARQAPDSRDAALNEFQRESAADLVLHLIHDSHELNWSNVDDEPFGSDEYEKAYLVDCLRHAAIAQEKAQ